MTDQQRDDHERDDEGGIGQATDSTMGQGDTGTDVARPEEGGSADNDGGTIGDYVTANSKNKGNPAERNPGV